MVSKGAKSVIAAILAILIALWKQSRKKKATPALTNSPKNENKSPALAKAPAVSEVPEPKQVAPEPVKPKQVAPEPVKPKEVAPEPVAQDTYVPATDSTIASKAGIVTPRTSIASKEVETPATETTTATSNDGIVTPRTEASNWDTIIVECPDDKDLEHHEVTIGDKVLYSDGQEGVVDAFDVDGDLKVRKISDGTTANWYANKCSKAEIKIGDSVRHSCGERARVESVDNDGDFIVRKPSGNTSTWYKTKTTGVPVKMSKNPSRDSAASLKNASLVGA